MGMMSDLHLDMQRIDQIRSSIPQRYAVAKLVGYCEAIAGSGLLGEPMEANLRARIAETLSAFNMEHHQEQS